jgi:hypothetical protein
MYVITIKKTHMHRTNKCSTRKIIDQNIVITILTSYLIPPGAGRMTAVATPPHCIALHCIPSHSLFHPLFLSDLSTYMSIYLLAKMSSF